MVETSVENDNNYYYNDNEYIFQDPFNMTLEENMEQNPINTLSCVADFINIDDEVDKIHDPKYHISSFKASL